MQTIKSLPPHTPGPWKVQPSGKVGNGTAWRDIVSEGAPFTPSYVGEALEQDAYLIAAAPDLLEALRGLLDALPPGFTSPAQARAHEAIAKATSAWA